MKAKEPQLEYAMVHHWWAWNHPRIHELLAVAIISAVGPMASATLKSNRSRRMSPLSIEDLSSWKYLRRHSSHTGRVLTGGNLATIQFLLGISTALNLPLNKVIPDEWSIVAAMTAELCERVIPEADAQLYARYRCLLGGSASVHLDANAVRQAQELSGNSSTAERNAEERILAVARSLTPHLVAIDTEIENRKE